MHGLSIRLLEKFFVLSDMPCECESKMPTGEHGLKRAITEIVGGFITSAIISAFVKSGILDPSFILLFHLLNVIFIISLLLKMKYWGTSYLLGWLFGLLLMSQTGLVGTLELLIYFAVPIIYLIIRKTRTEY